MLFVTGFPGFLASSLMPALLARTDDPIVCLVQPRYRALAEARAAALAKASGMPAARIRLVEGDLTVPDLGLRGDRFEHRVREVYHFAAVYDLGVGAALAEAVNVRGTAHVLAFAQACPRLEKLHYVSTCYVSGRYEGVFTEADLDVGQTFNNHYEESKFRAEVNVQAAMKNGLPATIYRPSIVVGDSRTGATQKFDGPYYVIRWLLRWGRLAPVPMSPDAARRTVNLVPRDYVTDAMAYLSRAAGATGRVYHLCDPAPLTAKALLAVLADATRVRVLPVPVPLRPLTRLLERIPLLDRAVGIEPQAFPYFDHPARYGCAQTLAALEGSRLACPPFAAYAHRLVEFVRAHPDISPAAMV